MEEFCGFLLCQQITERRGKSGPLTAALAARTKIKEKHKLKGKMMIKDHVFVWPLAAAADCITLR